MNTCAALAWLLEDQEHVRVVDEIRAEHDKAFGRWMPHINFIFPFIAEDRLDDAAARLRTELAAMQPFDLRLDDIGSFSQRDKATVHLRSRDNAAMTALFAAIQRALPEVPVKHAQFHPHMTLGQWPKQAVPDAMLRAHFGPGITARVRAVCIITRPRDGPFTVHTAIPLGGQ
eukprot:m.242138 g.242138  ORF g.242138 m.242138 type:complete len:173 (+) comp13971_c0_seq1:54-572(+)